MAGEAGIEPATYGFGDRCSAKLSYSPAIDDWPVVGSRTPQLPLFRLPMQLVGAAPGTVLHKLQPPRIVTPVLLRCVIPFLAIYAS